MSETIHVVLISGLYYCALAAGIVSKGAPAVYGVANHIGDMSGGHYTAHAKNPHTGQWCEYNDSTVSRVSASAAVSTKAYLLFYSSVDFDGDLF